jgi:uncharacterized membrane protein
VTYTLYVFRACREKGADSSKAVYGCTSPAMPCGHVYGRICRIMLNTVQVLLCMTNSNGHPVTHGWWPGVSYPPTPTCTDVASSSEMEAEGRFNQLP